MQRDDDPAFWWFWLAALTGLFVVAVALGDDTRDFAARNVHCTIHAERPRGIAQSAIDVYDYAPYVEVESPLYRAIYNRETRCCVWINYLVRAEDVVNDNATTRGWWFPGELLQYGVLGNVHYRDSGYDRGHLRSIQMSRGSEHWRDVNCLCVVVPEVPALNRGEISWLESRICDLALEHGWCDVTITLSGDAGDFRPGVTHQIPETIRYVVESPEGREEFEYSNLKAEPTPARRMAPD